MARSELWWPRACFEQQLGRPAPLPGIGSEKLQHFVVGTSGTAGEREGDRVFEVEVTNRQRIWVAQRSRQHGANGPLADAGQEA